jgi:non-homologous end joining protein Ku
MNLAPAPKRSTIAFQLNFGMLPVRLRCFAPYQDAAEAVKPHQYVPVEVEDDDGETTIEYHPVGNKNYDKITGDDVTDGIIKMVTLPGTNPGEPEVLVELTDDEKALVTAGHAVDRGDVPIETFVPLDTIGSRYHVKSSHQVRPALRQEKKKSVPDKNANKAFALFMAAMAEKQVGCLIRMGLRASARYGIITPDGMVHWLHFDAEVREDFPWPDVTVSDGEVKGAGGLIDGYGVDTPDLVDESGKALYEYLAKKADTGEVVEALPEPETSEQDDDDLDFTALLEASVTVVKSAKAKVNA